MPFLSIVVPVYRVAGFLRDCLDSILDQGAGDLEVVAVNDCSPDHSGQILDEYAARDARVRVVHLVENVGLGRARAAGLAVATGEYIWFVDSDDCLAPGSLRAVVDRLRSVAPEMLIVDHARISPTGEMDHGDLCRLLPPETTPAIFSPAEQPAVLHTFHTAWARITHRSLLNELGDSIFQSGWYEDVAFTLPLLVAAKRISVLHRVCYHYRIRPGGITGSTSARHMEVFDQYERVFEILEKRQILVDASIRSHLWLRMLIQYGWILSASKRVPAGLYREFFARAHAHHDKFRPSGRNRVTPVPGLPTLTTTVKRTLIGRNWWRMFRLMTVVKRFLGRSKTLLRACGAAVRRIVRLGHAAALRTYYYLQTRRPIDPSLAVYFAYWGQAYACNPAAIYEKARVLVPSVRGIWLMAKGRERVLPAGTPYVLMGSFAAERVLARAKYLVSNVNFPDYVVKRPGSVHLQTHHGTPLKVMGMDHHRHPLGAKGMDLERLLRRCQRWDLSISTSPFNTEVWQRAYPGTYETLEVGYPRNDRLYQATEADVARIRKELGLEPSDLAVLYLPTHREYASRFLPMLDVERFADELGPQVRLLARVHYFYPEEWGRYADSHPRVLDVSGHPRIEDLYLAADVLISDYSSAIFDYAHLDRPIVIFAPDWEAYRVVRGVTFDLMEHPPGVVARTFAELVEVFRNGDFRSDEATRLRSAFRDRFCPHRSGTASESVVRRTFREALANPRGSLD